jgi:hypothetical protein
LRLDADYQLSDALIAELAKLDPNAAVSVGVAFVRHGETALAQDCF